MSPDNLLGWFASGLVFAAFCAREMLPLRLLAIASNIAFIGYGRADHLWPIVFLHSATLPMNVIRLRQLVRAPRDAPASWRENERFGASFHQCPLKISATLECRRALLADESRRWPWQGPRPRWRTVGAKWSSAYREDFWLH